MNWYQSIAHYFPLFHVSDDDQFGDIGEKTERKDLRYSLFTIWMGQYLIHILSIKDGHLSLVKVLNLDVILDNTFKVNEESIGRYAEALKGYKEETIRDQIEALKLKIDEERSRYDTTLTKTAVYNAALLVALSVVFPYLFKLYEMKSIFLMILVPFGLIFYISALILSFKMLRITSINSFGFNDVAKNEDSLRGLAAGLYNRYKHANVEADKIVSYNTNLQKNTRQLLVWALIALLALNAQGLFEKLNKPLTQPVGIYHMNREKNKIINLQALNKIENRLITGQSIRVIIAGGEDDQVKKVHDILDFYNVKDVPIDILKSKNDSQLSIIVVEGDN